MTLIWPNGPWLTSARPPSPAPWIPRPSSGARLGIWRAPSAAAGAATGAVLDMAVAKLRAVGAVVIDPVTLPQAGQIAGPEFTALRHEFKYGINAYLAYLAGFGFAGSLPRTLAELIDFNKRNADLVLSRFGQEIFEASEATSGDLADPGYLAARREATRLARAAISAPLAEHGIEAIVALTANPAGLTDYVLGDHDVFHTSGPGRGGRAARRSPCRPGRSPGCRSACRSSARAGASRG